MNDSFQLNKCLLCSNSIEQKFGWQTIFRSPRSETICPTCESKLDPIIGEVCLYCGKQLDRIAPAYQVDGICMDCLRWMESGQLFLDGNTSLFHYNDFLKEIIAQIKYRGDYQLMAIFSKFLKAKPSSVLIVPIPLSEERHLERGFNQAEAIGTFAGFPMVQALTRRHSEKQAKKTRIERILSEQVFQLNNVNVAGATILLLDDIYTTGTTLQHAAQMLKVFGKAKTVYSLTLAHA